ncbi:histone H1-like [Neoarius graeffei]|uniref:histone H1-like n=1 Tax=Neoarius graeffei TaxID=443677 RepID=UPI00298D222D|nr:histone H1-like [Neoarius graeffei]
MARSRSRRRARQSARGESSSKDQETVPSAGELIIKAVSSSQERSGVSLSALKKALQAAGYDVEKNNSRIKIAVNNLVRKGVLVQTKGTGASGSFKLNKTQTEGKKPAKKAAAKKPTAKKATTSPKKAKKPPTPKKAAKSAKTQTAKPKAVKPKTAKAKKAAPKKK